jgi:hypothetical protein
MKYVFYSVIVLMAVLPAQAQQTQPTADACILQQKSDSSALDPSVVMESDETKPAELLVGYALNVDGLLLGLGDQMRTVSEKVEAGELTQLEAVVLKLELTRTMIARLQTISAVYDSVIFANPESEAAPDSAPADNTPAPAMLHANRTISVQELKEENAQ